MDIREVLNLACGCMLKPMEIDLPPFYFIPLCFSENSFSAHELQSRALLVSGTLGRTVMKRLEIQPVWTYSGVILALRGIRSGSVLALRRLWTPF